MAGRVCVAIAAVAVLVRVPAAAGPGQPPSSRFDIYATIVDAMGAPAVDLLTDDVHVTERGQDASVIAVQPLRWPLSVQLLVDNGSGLDRQNIGHLRNGARGFFEALPAGAEVTFVTTAPQPRFLVRAATSPEPLFESVGRLAPDGGSGHLLDALSEATDRIERGERERFSVIVAVSTIVGDADARDRDLERVLRRLRTQPTTVHVVHYAGGSQRTLTGGANQTQIGLSVTRATGGRYESISAATRLASLLPEIAEQVAKSYLDGRVRITVGRAPGASGEPRDVRLATRRGLAASGVSFDARLP